MDFDVYPILKHTFIHYAARIEAANRRYGYYTELVKREHALFNNLSSESEFDRDWSLPDENLRKRTKRKHID